ncbi:aspartate/glutamate racemase family protein [Avibacterium volantium]|uniref:Putative racemase n=1 Tax=Avibacterium volantium TaxID=762 RepID=A0A3S4HIF1_AVIVO|nr:putative racemase [Avibacterium volantium]
MVKITPPPILLNRVGFEQIVEYQKSGNWQKAGEVLAQAARVLKNSGADAIVLATNKMHKVAPQIIETTTIPFLNIIDASNQAILQRKLHKIGLLIQQTDCKLPFFDTALLHIQAAADFLFSGE